QLRLLGLVRELQAALGVHQRQLVVVARARKARHIEIRSAEQRIQMIRLERERAREGQLRLLESTQGDEIRRALRVGIRRIRRIGAGAGRASQRELEALVVVEVAGLDERVGVTRAELERL